MDGERSDVGGGGGGGDPEVEDEFACAGMLRGYLTSLHGSVERIFTVTFRIGADDLPHGDDGQIWLKLRGPSSNVKAAKLFVKGVVNQEEQQEVSYPGVLHCVFCGARGLFVDSLVKNTSAHIVVGSPGSLLISGLAEPVVRAYSLIADLVERYEGTQSRRPETGDRGSGESLDSRRAFKTLVETWEDRHILDLLVLPVSVKEILLDLVKEAGLGSNPKPMPTGVKTQERSQTVSKGRQDKQRTTKQTLHNPSSTADRWAEGMTAGKDSAGTDSFFQPFSSSAGGRGRAEGAEERLTHSPQEVGEEEQVEAFDTRLKDGREKNGGQEAPLSTGNKEFLLLLKFFTVMGYSEDVVRRVLARTGPKEASQILDLVQQEQDRSEQNSQHVPDPKNEDGVALDHIERNRPCETEHREDEGAVGGGEQVLSSNGEAGDGGEGSTTGSSGGFQKEGSAEEKEAGQEEDFVLGVLKKAAASCGYDEQNVAKAYNMFPERSTHELLLELQREGSRETDAFRAEPREMDDVVLEDGPKDRPAEVGARGEVDLFLPAERRETGEKGQINLTAPKADPDVFSCINNHQHTSHPKQHQTSKSQTPHQVILPEVKGPPMPVYTSSLDLPLTNLQSNKQHAQPIYWPNQSPSKQNHHHNPKPQSALKQALQAPQPAAFANKDSSPTRARDRRGFTSSVVVTGEQRFLEGLQMPFELKLTDKPGDPKLRTIVIDGSNVAMSHGLGHFFSCRGIALAVQHFWDRGHRNISALLPQWRQKSDPKIKEQHYLTELQKVGVVSYTPSREVQGKRISSYDDRLILQLAQKTGGVIVTNDNLRDLSDESPAWRNIIKNRLLQYTFVGDHFMVPDDPLGRGGPHLDDFLRALDASGGRGGRGRGRGHQRGWEPGHQHRQHVAAGAAVDRSPEETAALREQLCQVFPGQDNMVTLVLQCHPAETDINVLSDLILEQQKD
uniref:NEDD4-binding protein 1-like n=1 Tax=Stegastes partitus TaxID=144197 RepID=A0A3B5AA70_9TELE